MKISNIVLVSLLREKDWKRTLQNVSKKYVVPRYSKIWEM